MPEAEEEAEEAGVNNLVFMQCFQDSPEESLWVSGILKLSMNISLYACSFSHRFMRVPRTPLMANSRA